MPSPSDQKLFVKHLKFGFKEMFEHFDHVPKHCLTRKININLLHNVSDEFKYIVCHYDTSKNVGKRMFRDVAKQ